MLNDHRETMPAFAANGDAINDDDHMLAAISAKVIKSDALLTVFARETKRFYGYPFFINFDENIKNEITGLLDGLYNEFYRDLKTADEIQAKAIINCITTINHFLISLNACHIKNEAIEAYFIRNINLFLLSSQATEEIRLTNFKKIINVIAIAVVSALIIGTLSAVAATAIFSIPAISVSSIISGVMLGVMGSSIGGYMGFLGGAKLMKIPAYMTHDYLFFSKSKYSDNMYQVGELIKTPFKSNP